MPAGRRKQTGKTILMTRKRFLGGETAEARRGGRGGAEREALRASRLDWKEHGQRPGARVGWRSSPAVENSGAGTPRGQNGDAEHQAAEHVSSTHGPPPSRCSGRGTATCPPSGSSCLHLGVSPEAGRVRTRDEESIRFRNLPSLRTHALVQRRELRNSFY